jgi:signal transduction histidine kinase
VTSASRPPYSIRKRVGLLVGFGSLAPIVIALFLLRFTSNDIARHLYEEHQRLAGSLALHLDSELRGTLTSLAAAIGTPADWSDGRARHALRALFLRSPTLEAIVAVAQTESGGRNIAWREQRHGELPARLFLTSSNVAQALQTGRQGVARLSSEGHDRRVMLIPVHDWSGQITSVVCAVLDPAAPTWLTVLGQGALDDGSASLVDDKGDTVVAVIRGRASPTPPPQRPDDVTAEAALSIVPWHVVLRLPREQVLGPLDVQRGRILMLAPLVLGLALGFAFGAAHSVTEPLKALGHAAKRIADGDLDQSVPAQANDEVGQLGRSLETMRLGLKKSLDDLTSSHDALEQRVQERTQELRRLLTKLVSVQEDERKRIARELHDETCQTLAALGMKLDAALAAPSADVARERLGEARAFASRTLSEIHALIYELRPSVLDDLGLFPALRWLADRNLTPAGISFRCEVSVSEHALTAERETTLFRAAQEAVRNVARHSQASQVLIQVEERERDLVVEIEDDGQGFDPTTVAEPSPSGRGLGLLGMRERMALVGGSATVISSPHDGTRVVLRVPFEEGSQLG